MKQVDSTVPENSAGQRIDRYLAGRFSYLSRHAWQKEVESGNVLINGFPAKSCHQKIRAGDTVSYSTREIPEPAVNKDFSIVFEDEYILGINKPANLPVHPAGRFLHNTLLMELQKQKQMKLYPIHRLDRETSGIILFSKDKTAASILQRNYNSSVSKVYIAIVQGRPGKKSFTIDMPIGNDMHSVVRKKRAAYPGAPEEAITQFSILLSMGEFSLLKASPLTGRQHQIRVHALYAGLPIIGDKIYGIDESMYLRFIEEGNSPDIIRKLGFPRTALHARSLVFMHPVLKKKIRVRAELPQDFTLFLKGKRVWDDENA